MSKEDAIKELTCGETSSSIKRKVKNKPIVADPKEPQEKNMIFPKLLRNYTLNVHLVRE